MKLASYLMALVFPSLASAGEYTDWEYITEINIIGSSGFQVLGDFGSVNSCELTNQVFIKSDHPQYGQIYSMVLAAYSSSKRIKFYVNSCQEISWISNSTIGIAESQIDIAD